MHPHLYAVAAPLLDPTNPQYKRIDKMQRWEEIVKQFVYEITTGVRLSIHHVMWLTHRREMERSSWRDLYRLGQESMSLIASLPSANWMSGTGLERGLTEFWRICWRKLNGHRMCNICTYFIITDSRISCFSATFILIKHQQQQQQEAGREAAGAQPRAFANLYVCIYMLWNFVVWWRWRRRLRLLVGTRGPC